MEWLFKRLSEPSTWSAIAAAVTPLVGAGAGIVSWQMALTAAAPAVLGVVLKETGK